MAIGCRTECCLTTKLISHLVASLRRGPEGVGGASALVAAMPVGGGVAEAVCKHKHRARTTDAAGRNGAICRSALFLQDRSIRY